MWPIKTSTKNKNIQVNLLEPIVFVGSNLDSLPVIRGTIEINIDNKIKSLHLFFQGVMKTLYLQSNIYFY